MDTFVHDPIDLSQPAIRLARLLGGYCTDSVRCEIFEAFLDLSEIIPYNALSYVWGDESEKNEICINEKRAFVTNNLFKALKSLRQIDEDVILWVDAMCIDQSNNKEKGHQVSQMRLVYDRAEEVIIWLGESDADIDILFDGASKLDKAVGKLRTHNTAYEVWKTVWEEKEKERLRFDARSEVRAADRRSSALRKLLRRPWFKRVWVIQEAASAKRATVRCGQNAVPTRTFAMLPQLMGEEVDSHVHALLDVMPGPSRSTSSWWNASRDLETLLRKFGRSESSNPCDAIYALLGISSNFKDNRVLSPDYEATFVQAVQNTIWALLFGEVFNRILYKLPTWDKMQFLDSLQDLPGSVFDWAISAMETSVLVRLLTRGGGPGGVQVQSSSKGFLDHKLPLHTLIEKDGPLSAIQAFMPHADLDINRMSDRHGHNGPLHLAAKRGLESVVGVLLKHPKVDVNLPRNGSIGKNIQPIRRSYSDLSNFDEDPRAYERETPLNIAVAECHPSVVKLLLQYRGNNARVQVKDAGGTPLHLAAAVHSDYLGDPDCSKSAEVVKLLLQHEDVDLNGKNWRGHSPLNIAVIQENLGMIELLLQLESIDVNHFGAGCTPLGSAVETENPFVVGILVNDARTDHGEVLRLLKRAVLGPIVLVESLLAGCSDRDGEVLGQALVRASEYGNLSLIQMLLDKGARTNGHGEPWVADEPDDYQHNMTPLCAAVNKGNDAAVSLLLQNGVQPDDLDKNISGEVIQCSEKAGKALALAVRQGRASIVESLLVYGASVHHKAFHGTTPLLELLHQDSHGWWKVPGKPWISEKGMKCSWDTRAIEMLSLYGANISSDGLHRDEWTKLSLTKASISLGNAFKWDFGEFAALEGHQLEVWLEIKIKHDLETTRKLSDIARVLLVHGADIEARDSRGVTILWMAVCRDYTRLVDLLLNFGADTEATDSIHGQTSLWVAALLDFGDTVHKLLEKGANKEVRCKQGKTPLCIAAEKGCRKAVRALLDFQADLHAKDTQGRTPFDLAQENGHEDIARMCSRGQET